MKKDTSKSDLIGFRATAHQAQEIERMCAEKHMKKSEIVRAAVELLIRVDNGEVQLTMGGQCA